MTLCRYKNTIEIERKKKACEKRARNEDSFMDTVKIITLLLGLLSGIALFLYGMSVMGDGIKKVAGNKLETLLYKLTSNPVKGILLGAGVTAIIQSSSATSVMVVGFVNSGMMKVIQGISIIMGANIGTSITGWILCLSDIQGAGGIASLLSSTSIAAIMAILGLLVRSISKKDSYRAIGDILFGFTILMMGMSAMKTAMEPLQGIPQFTGLLTKFSNPWYFRRYSHYRNPAERIRIGWYTAVDRYVRLCAVFSSTADCHGYWYRCFLPGSDERCQLQ